MSEMVDRVATAIYKQFENRPRYAQLQMNVILAEELARAAIEAMREPTDEMIEGGRISLIAAQGSIEAKALGEASNAKWTWIEMIDAALSDEPPKPDITEAVTSIDHPH